MISVRRGVSRNPDPAGAARELGEQLMVANTGAVVFFCSSTYDLETLGTHLADRCACPQLVGCSTAGEISPDGYEDRSIVGVSFGADDYVTVSERIEDLSITSLARVCDMVRALVVRLRLRAPSAAPSNTFALLLIDGMAGVEEPVLSAIGRELDDIPLVGGSAGDNLRFRETVVFHGGSFSTASAVLLLVHTWLPFEVFKTQHFVTSDVKMVVTEADPTRRTVSEINAEPASEEYARLVGVEASQAAQPIVLATHPVLVRVGGDDYARSIQKVNDDGSLTFYCAIDEGIVLSAGSGADVAADLDRLFARITRNVGRPEAILGFDCIFRRLEFQQRRIERTVSQMLAANNVIGFSTYGEQFRSMHLNQTFSGVALGGRPEAS